LVFDLMSVCVVFQHCEESLPEQEKHIEELLRLSEQITQLLGLEDSTSTGLALATEVEALGKRLDDVRCSIGRLAEAAEGRALQGEICGDDLKSTRNYLDNVQEVRFFLFYYNLFNLNSILAFYLSVYKVNFGWIY